MAYKFQRGAATLSGSLTLDTAETLTLSGLLSSSAKISGSAFFGDGSELTGIASDQIDLDDGSGLSGITPIVFGANGSVGGAAGDIYGDETNVFGYTPSSGLLQVPGAVSGSGGLSGSSLVLGGGNAYIAVGGAVVGQSLSDSTATLSAGALSGVTTIALNSTITGGTSYSGSAGLSGSSLVVGGGNAYIDVGGGAMFDGTLQVDGRLDIGNGVRYDSVSVKTGDFTLTNANSIIVASGSSDIDLTLPGSPTAGEFYMIKRHANMENDVTILSASAGNGASIDGDSTIVLETAAAAVSLVYEDTTDTWSVF